LLNAKLFRAQIPKAQKATEKLDCLFALLGSACIKASCKHVDEIDPCLPGRAGAIQSGRS